MKPGTRVQTLSVGGQLITGTVVGPGKTQKIRPLNSLGDQDIETAVVKWDEPHLGTETVAAAGLEVIDE